MTWSEQIDALRQELTDCRARLSAGEQALRDILAFDPGYSECEELLDIARAALAGREETGGGG